METNLDSSAVHILGYRMIEKIGAGGYGEVWKAEAPGGLFKAIKILYGYHDERRAQMELKSLERVKQLRHPFLLSLERIDIVDGQMIVITELADRSLADVFDTHVAQGKPGIPREELLRNMLQIAEALDFLALEHSLQHLDVKPENFLLVGQHAKLADFGLVKDLHTMNQSLLGGMTPTYAPPELFDGRPSLCSDQYSLAIVYQEMLTGERPFSGSSAAQLAAQHMHGKPNLRALPTNDQPIIAKALSKDPTKRFKSCREMVEELLHRKTLVKTTKKVIAPARRSSGSTLGPGHLHQVAVTRKVSENLIHEKLPLKYADAPSISSQPAAFSPVLFLGLGRMGTRILHGLKQRIEQQLGPLDDLPSIALLALDTDRGQLLDAGGDGSKTRLSHREVLSLPLRRPEEYRERTKSHTQWLNRRWIYNVPKSLQTEGLRPLGRLAFVDNFEVVWERLNQLMEQIATAESIARTLQKLEMQPSENHPRIFLVGAISGGIASGAILDLAYVAKLLLLERGFPHHNVHSILLHGVDSQHRDGGVSIANTFAFLSEMRQYLRDGFPGESTCGLPDMPGDAPFENAYLIDLGTNLPEEKLARQLNQAADYLFLSNLSPCRTFFDACRELDQNQEKFTLRSFGICSMGLGYSSELGCLADYFVDQILSQWTGSATDNTAAEGTGAAAALVPDCDSSRQHFLSQLEQAVPADLIQDAVSAVIQLTVQGQPNWKHPLDQLLGAGPHPQSGNLTASWLVDGDTLARRRAASLAQSLRAELFAGFHGERMNLAAIDSLRNQIQNWLGVQAQLASSQLAEFDQKVQEVEAGFGLQIVKRKDKHSDPDSLRKLIQAYVEMRLNQLAARCNCEFYKAIARQLEEIRSDFERTRLRMTAAAKFFRSQQPRRTGLAGSAADVFLQALLRDKDRILNRIELRLFHETVAPRGSYWDVVQDASCLQAQLLPALATAALTEVVEAGRTISLDRLYESENGRPDSWTEVIQQLLTGCEPMITSECGGNARVLVGTPKGSTSAVPRQSIEASLQVQIAEANLNSGDLVLAAEVDDLSLADFAMELYRSRTDCIELASRLQSRNDVTWSPLQELL